MTADRETISYTCSDEAPAFHSGGWRPHAYRLAASALRVEGARLEIDPGLVCETIGMEQGVLRVRGAVRSGWLVIGFLSRQEIGSPQGGETRMIAAPSGADLGFTLAGSGTLHILHFPPSRAARQGATGREDRFPADISLFSCPLSQAGRDLMTIIDRIRRRGDEPAPATSPEELVALGRRVAGDIVLAHSRGGVGTSRRRLARIVEDLLREEPASTGLARVSLDSIVERLQFSRRTIQLALHDEFGLGFVALKRAIRLQQARAALQRGDTIGRAAKAHEFQHLSRFSAQYRTMFGALPSDEFSSRRDAARPPSRRHPQG